MAEKLESLIEIFGKINEEVTFEPCPCTYLVNLDSWDMGNLGSVLFR